VINKKDFVCLILICISVYYYLLPLLAFRVSFHWLGTTFSNDEHQAKSVAVLNVAPTEEMERCKHQFFIRQICCRRSEFGEVYKIGLLVYVQPLLDDSNTLHFWFC